MISNRNKIIHNELANEPSLYQTDLTVNAPTNTNPPTIRFEHAFDQFLHANSSRSILKCFDNICECLHIDRKQIFEKGHVLNAGATPSPLHLSYTHHSSTGISHVQSNHNRITTTRFFPGQSKPVLTRLVYQVIKSKSDYWKANELWKRYEKRVNSKDYAKKSDSFKELEVLIIGCGPVGLRLAIECAFLGLKVTIVEKRDKYVPL